MIVSYHEFGHRISRGDSWLDYDQSGVLAAETVLDAVIE
jgi:hypothetical protein